MGDIITRTAVLYKGNPEWLYLATSDGRLRILPVRPAETERVSTPEWSYKVEGDRLVVTPSLLCSSTGFHTDYEWSVKFVEIGADESGYSKFLEINPDLRDTV